MRALTLKEFREATKDLPDSAVLFYHACDKGCSLAPYNADDLWIFQGRDVVVNPGADYDDRRPKTEGDQRQ